MMKMLIQLDEEKIKSKGFNSADLWANINSVFAEKECLREEQSNGAVLYSGNPHRAIFTDFGSIFLSLRHKKWFAETCSQWIWYDNEDDENLPLQDIDVLTKERKRNPLFAVA